MEEIKVKAELGQLETVIQFIDGQLDKISCGVKAKLQIEVAVEEIFVNIAHYAYPDTDGMAVIRFGFDGKANIATICFLDSGTPYNPLVREEPDTTLSAEERSIGGLGIYMVKKTMDSIMYEYKDGNNVLTIQKNACPSV